MYFWSANGRNSSGLAAQNLHADDAHVFLERKWQKFLCEAVDEMVQR